MYRLARPLLFRVDAERTHDMMLSLGAHVQRSDLLLDLLDRRYGVEDERLRQDVAGLEFPGPVGLAAGYDKNAVAVEAAAALGFGHIETGTVTAEPQAGNPRPRIIRQEDRQGMVNWMGFPNEGADAAADRLAGYDVAVPLGVNVGMNRDAEAPLANYRDAFQTVAPHADYVTVNPSSPNTPGLRDLQEEGPLRQLLTTLDSANAHDLPVFVKISPDLDEEGLDGVARVAESDVLDGVIATNTTTDHDREQGGQSGRPLTDHSTRIIAYLDDVLPADVPIIGVGGVFTVEDAVAKLEAGASLVQLFTALPYRGPSVVRDIDRGLLAYRDENGYSSLDELAGRSG